MMDLVSSLLGHLFGGTPLPEHQRESDDMARHRFYAAEREAAHSRGWMDFASFYYRVPGAENPYEHSMIWIWRPEWNELPKAVNPHALDPYLNANGLLWKKWRASDPATPDPTLLPN